MVEDGRGAADRIEILLSERVKEQVADRDAAYAAAGWEARTAVRWTIDELAQKIIAAGGSGGDTDR